MPPCRAITSPLSATRSMRGFCKVNRSVVADSRYVPNSSLRMGPPSWSFPRRLRGSRARMNRVYTLRVMSRLGLCYPTGDTRYMTSMDFEFEGQVIEWRGPAPYYFLAIPEEESEDIKFAAKGLEY